MPNVNRPNLRSPRLWLAAGALSALVASALLRPGGAGAVPPPPLPVPPGASPSLVPGADAGVSTTPATAQIMFTTVPPVQASVSWGKKKLGRIMPTQPLIVVRPRDSGSLDVVVRAEGYLPVHTRAHTFSDSKVLVKLTPIEQMNTVLGYRVPLDAGVPTPPGVGEDAGIVIDPGLPPPTAADTTWP